MKFGICVYTEDIAAAERAGYDYVELTVTHVMPERDKTEWGELKKKLAPFSIRPEAWRRFLPSSLPVVGSNVEFSKLRAYIETVFGRIAELRGRIVVFGSPGARNVPAGFPRERACHQVTEFLQMAAEEAAKDGITVVIEPIMRKNCNIINSIHEARVLAKEVDRKEVKILADLCHMTTEREPVEAVREAGKDLYHVHLPVPDLAGLGEPRAITDLLPDYPTEAFLKELVKLDYDARISVEDLDRRFMNLEREAPIVLSYVREIWSRLTKTKGTVHIF